MATYRIEFRQAARRALADLPTAAQRRLDAAILGLAQDPRPRGCKKLAGEADLWRIRVGLYRVVYTVKDDVLLVLVVKIGHRREVYRGR